MSKITWLERISIKVQRRVPDLSAEHNQGWLNDLIEDAFTQIVRYAKADKYDTAWDNLLVSCVVALYNYSGMEGSTSRSADGIRDVYESSNILSQLLSRNITPNIKPSGYKFSPTRFDFPTIMYEVE
jgi:hypothetical protein